MKSNTAVLLLVLVGCSVALAQSARPTFGILSRVTMVQSQYGRGSTFSIDLDGREYWVTAKHILTGAKHPPHGSITSQTASLQILDPSAEGERWITALFSLLDAGDNIDIVVLAPAAPLLNNPVGSVKLSSDGVPLGGDCTFLGFPFGGGWRGTMDGGKSYWMPFTKHCMVSAFTRAPERIWTLDGINNAGFSGGPVLFRTGAEQGIFAVVSGYVTEPAEVVSSARKRGATKPRATTPETQTEQRVNVNSGFILAYDINYAIQAIHKNPIGPLRTAISPK